MIRIGFITDLSGPYAGVDGPAGAEAIRMAVADLGGTVAGKRVEVLIADHHNKSEVAAAQAREWFDTGGVDVLIGGVNTDTSLAMAEVARQKHKLFIVVGAGSTVHTREQRSPYTIQYAYDTATLAQVTGDGVVKAGGKSWFILTADYPFGLELEKYTTATVQAAGGRVVGAVRHPHEVADFAPFLRQAQRSGAQVVGLASGHTALVEAVRAANKLGLTKTRKLAGLLVFIDDIHALGLPEAQGMYHADSWYWNRDAETRAWSRRFFAKFGRMPSSLHAGDYSAALEYLRAVQASNSDEADQVLAQLRKAEFNDVFVRNGHLRPDGLLVHDMYLLQVKSPEQATEPWDYDTIIETVRGDAAVETPAPAKDAHPK
ncbi:ABC transporter substrate-binding protein [uncultured Hymenobacter sp.]|uniref:ABC transporter substrate-binding protein n=1 Tax=uncultured Hymenobacter sp. TaxID=170016 RepID=UPI0035CB194C